MKISQREAVLALVTITAIMFGGGFFLVRPKLEYLRELRDQQEQVAREIADDRDMVEQSARWEQEFRMLSEQLPRFPSGKKMDIYWLSKMDQFASNTGVQINKRQAKEEVDQGDVYELSVECMDWEASLDQLTHFLFDLQSEGAMFDMRQLLIKPKEKGVLRGRFVLYCAYTKEETPPATP